LTPSGATVTDYPEGTFGAGRYLLVWDTSDSPATLVGARLEPDLTLVDTTPIVFATQTTQSSGNGTVPGYASAAFDGTRYVIAHGNFIMTGGVISYDTKFTAITTAGAAQTPVTVTTNDTSSSNFDPRAIAATPSGRALVSYTLWDRPIGYDITRVRYKTYSTTRSPIGGGCNTNADCAMGTCVDGVCCASACAGGATDCQACNLISGSSSNGVCEPLENGTACGMRGGCQAGTCIVLPDPGTGGSGGSSNTGGSAGSGGASGTAGAGTGGGTSGGSTSTGGASAGGSGGTSDGGEPPGGAGGEDSTGGTAGGGASGASGTTNGGSNDAGASGTTSGNGGNATSGAGNSSNGKKSSSDESSGCGCRTASTNGRASLGLAWLAVALALFRRRFRYR
jgi:MYXO-CTERM domain-containing protein